MSQQKIKTSTRASQICVKHVAGAVAEMSYRSLILPFVCLSIYPLNFQHIILEKRYPKASSDPAKF